MQSYRTYIEKNRDHIIRDIQRLVNIRSVKSEPKPGAPYGEGVRAAQLAAMALCQEAGLEVTDLGGRIAWGHYGDPDRFIGVIAHLDVVPEGTGWQSDPYDLTIRDGYLVGRGVGDDKGPFVLALYAIKYLIENKIKLNYGLRLIIGLDEESGMSDLEFYNASAVAPLFAFTPDSEFPVCHGEKGIYEADLISPAIEGGAIFAMEGGAASNVVADTAWAELDPSLTALLQKNAAGRSDIAVLAREDAVRVEAKGIARHAGKPEGGVNANRALLAFLLESNALTGQEAQAAAFMCRCMSSFDGEPFGIACDDGLFTPLTMIGGMMSKRENRYILNMNARFPTAITEQELQTRIADVCAQNGFTVEDKHCSAPFYFDPETPAVRLLCDIYNELTGSQEEPYVMSGGTYARHMHNAVSFGIELPQAGDPDWAGSAHMKNEAICMERAWDACEIFIHTLVKLQDVPL